MTIRIVCALVLVPVATILFVTPSANAQDDDGWTATLTPQVWLSHIDKNGFSPPPPLVVPNGVATNQREFTVTSRPDSSIDPQWGGQFVLQKKLWTVGMAAQYVSFETRNDIAASGSEINAVAIPSLRNVTLTVSPGQQIVQERVNSDRFDFDLALSYFVPAVLNDRLNLNAGLGFKFIYTSATRQFFNGLPGAGPTPAPLQFLYVKCNDNLTSCRFTNKVPVDDLFYGATVPLRFGLYPVSDKNLIVSFNVTPFIGAESRDDHNVVYASESGGPLGTKAKRLDGNTFAYGATGEVGVGYWVGDRVALYGGFRVQYFNGHEQYLAWGPVLSVSVLFGR